MKTLPRTALAVLVATFFSLMAQAQPLAPQKTNYSSVETESINGDYLAVSSGNWNDVSIWNVRSGGVWVPATMTPDRALYVISTDQNRIFLASNITVTITRSIASMQFVSLGGKIILDGTNVSLKIVGDKSHLRQTAFPQTTSQNGAIGILY